MTDSILQETTWTSLQFRNTSDNHTQILVCLEPLNDANIAMIATTAICFSFFAALMVFTFVLTVVDAKSEKRSMSRRSDLEREHLPHVSSSRRGSAWNDQGDSVAPDGGENLDDLYEFISPQYRTNGKDQHQSTGSSLSVSTGMTRSSLGGHYSYSNQRLSDIIESARDRSDSVSSDIRADVFFRELFDPSHVKDEENAVDPGASVSRESSTKSKTRERLKSIFRQSGRLDEVVEYNPNGEPQEQQQPLEIQEEIEEEKETTLKRSTSSVPDDVCYMTKQQKAKTLARMRSRSDNDQDSSSRRKLKTGSISSSQSFNQDRRPPSILRKNSSGRQSMSHNPFGTEFQLIQMRHNVRRVAVSFTDSPKLKPHVINIGSDIGSTNL